MGFYQKWVQTTKPHEQGFFQVPTIKKPAPEDSKPEIILPDRCPLHGGPVPAECRFAPLLFRRLFRERVVPTPDGSCPLREVCGLDPQRRTQKPVATKCLGFECDHVRYRQHDGMDCLWCDQAKQPVINMAACPMSKWERDYRGWPVSIRCDNG